MPTSLLTCTIDDDRTHHPFGGRTGAGDGSFDARLCQAQKQAMAGRLASGLVHDFNNILLVVGACLDQIVADPADAPVVAEQATASSASSRRSAGPTPRPAGRSPT